MSQRLQAFPSFIVQYCISFQPRSKLLCNFPSTHGIKEFTWVPQEHKRQIAEWQLSLRYCILWHYTCPQWVWTVVFIKPCISLSLADVGLLSQAISYLLGYLDGLATSLRHMTVAMALLGARMVISTTCDARSNARRMVASWSMMAYLTTTSLQKLSWLSTTSQLCCFCTCDIIPVPSYKPSCTNSLTWMHSSSHW